MKKIVTALTVAAMPFLWSSCTFHQEPDGLGEDPTDVNVTATVNLNLTLPVSESSEVDMLPTIADNLTHRFVVEATLPDGTSIDRQTFFEPVEEGKTTYRLPVRMNLNARQYKLMVWSDYVLAEKPDSNLVYNPATFMPVMPAYASYPQGNDRKDCFRACADLDLRQYADVWDAEVETEVALERPIGRYEIVTTDLGAFRNRLLDGSIPGNTFRVRVRYSSYLATGYNVLENVPKNYLSYMSFIQNINSSTLANPDNAQMRIAFDWLLCNPGDDVTEIPVEIEILNESDTQVARSFVNIPVKQGYNTVVTGRFLTSTDQGGVNIDGEYDGTIDINIGKI